MIEKTDNKKILITGGTSGLGLELVRLFHRQGYYVVTTGRREITVPEFKDRYTYYRIDFSDLELTASTFREIVKAHEFDIIINNAGVLSPPQRTQTKDGLEYTFQVNYLAHLLINEIVLSKQSGMKPLRIASITSPVYSLARVEINNGSNYRALRAYSNSKLYQALMCRYLIEHHVGKNLVCISFDPGTFDSGIYRMRGRLFILLYRIASPFMRSPCKVARVLNDVITNEVITNGVIYDFRKRIILIPVPSKEESEAFWCKSNEKISKYL
jgi:NAD(P)-dependent dehydrogenase (short-subunit alcohol dehydrogenase family)